MIAKIPNKINRVWLLHNNAAGNARQCVNLANAVSDRIENLRIEHRPFQLKRPYIWLPPEFTPRHTGIARPDWSKSVGGTFPDLIIACGRQSAPIAFSIRAQSEGKTKHVQILDPGSVRDQIDLLVVPEHDQVKGTDVMTTLGSLTPNISRQNVQRFGHLPRPLYCALIGGSDRKHRIKNTEAQALFDQLHQVAKSGRGLAITTSRRTDGLIAGLLSSLQNFPNVEFWHPTSLPGGTNNTQQANPYAAMLAEADVFLATPDSVNMVCEAASTGKGLMLVGSPEKVVAKKKKLHAALVDRGYVKPFDLKTEPWMLEPLRETERVADEIIQRFN